MSLTISREARLVAFGLDQVDSSSAASDKSGRKLVEFGDGGFEPRALAAE